jgi:hypothetical protein
MTKLYAAERLFEHGPLTGAQFRQITGWKHDICQWVLGELRRRQVIRLVRRGGGDYLSIYQLARRFA